MTPHGMNLHPLAGWAAHDIQTLQRYYAHFIARYQGTEADRPRGRVRASAERRWKRSRSSPPSGRRARSATPTRRRQRAAARSRARAALSRARFSLGPSAAALPPMSRRSSGLRTAPSPPPARERRRSSPSSTGAGRRSGCGRRVRCRPGRRGACRRGRHDWMVRTLRPASAAAIRDGEQVVFIEVCREPSLLHPPRLDSPRRRLRRSVRIPPGRWKGALTVRSRDAANRRFDWDRREAPHHRPPSPPLCLLALASASTAAAVLKAPRRLRPDADPQPAEQLPMSVDPGPLDPQAPRQLAGADQLRLVLPRSLLAQQLHDPGGDPLDRLRGEVDRDPMLSGSQAAPPGRVAALAAPFSGIVLTPASRPSRRRS